MRVEKIITVDGETYIFKTDRELSKLLGKSITYVKVIKREHPDFSYEDIIRWHKGENRKIGYPKKCIHVKGKDYIFCSDTEPSKLLGKTYSYVCKIKNRKPGISYKEIIEFATRSI